MVLGETEIFGQVKAAYKLALDTGTTSRALNKLFQQAFTVGKKVRNEIAFQAMASFERDIAKNLTLKARYTGFYNYTTIADPRNWDHRIETSFVAKINRYVSTSLSAIMIYDRDADRDVQVSYQLGFGLLATIGAVDK
jgi:hypothetical protein